MVLYVAQAHVTVDVHAHMCTHYSQSRVYSVFFITLSHIIFSLNKKVAILAR